MSRQRRPAEKQHRGGSPIPMRWPSLQYANRICRHAQCLALPTSSAKDYDTRAKLYLGRDPCTRLIGTLVADRPVHDLRRRGRRDPGGWSDLRGKVRGEIRRGCPHPVRQRPRRRGPRAPKKELAVGHLEDLSQGAGSGRATGLTRPCACPTESESTVRPPVATRDGNSERSQVDCSRRARIDSLG